MKRDYKTGTQKDVAFFTGIEIEHTPAFGLKTLFVVGIQSIDIIARYCQERMCEHVYLGANQSFNPTVANTEDWDAMINDVLKLGYLTTLDFDLQHAEWVIENCYCENNLFIPQISVKIPYISQFNYNTTLKIDDIDFSATNPGVWCHRLHDLQDTKKFTPWTAYKKDQPI